MITGVIDRLKASRSTLSIAYVPLPAYVAPYERIVFTIDVHMMNVAVLRQQQAVTVCFESYY